MKSLMFTSCRGIPGLKIPFGSGILLLIFLFSFNLGVEAQVRELTGTVVDTKGETVIGATVVVKGTTQGTTTDIFGKYRLNCSPENILVFSFVGMQTQEIKVDGNTVLNVIMQQAVESMDEVVVVGYGVQKKESVVGAVSQISGDKLKSIKMGGSVENSLQGKLPGLVVIMTDPTPGEEAMGDYYAAAPIEMVVRGGSSMNSNRPLIIVDGVERNFSNLDPNEIASITILKDASATAVYGVKGANGVIMVQTYRGHKGTMELDFTSNVTVKYPTMLPEYMNAYETLLLRNEAYRNDRKWDRIIPDDVLEHYRIQDEPYLYPDFDWMDYYFKPGFDQSYNLNARGGNDFVQYFCSVGFLGEGDVWTTGNEFFYDYDKHNASYWHNRYNFRNNLDFNLTKTTKLSVNLGGNIKVWGKPEDTFTQEQWFEPVTEMPFYPAEAQEQYPDNIIPYDQGVKRPMIDIDQGEARLHWMGGRGFKRFKSNEINADLIFDQKLDFITEGLSVGALYSYNSSIIYQQYFTVPVYYAYYLDPETETWSRYTANQAYDLDTPQPPLQVTNAEELFQVSRAHYYELRTSYNRTFEKHTVEALGLFSRRHSRYATDFPHYEENWVGRVAYNYDSRYFFESSFAYTGSERFAAGLRFGFFPSMAAGWLISNEKFFAPVKNKVNHFKIRYSNGTVGNDQGIPRWMYVSEYTLSGGGVAFGYPMQAYNYIQEGNIPVPDVTWEVARKQNIGLEFGFFQNLITLDIDLFNESRENCLQERQRVPSWVGVSSISGNIGSTKSHGFEIDLGISKYFENGLYLMATANTAVSENRVVYYDEPEGKPFNLKVEGKPVDIAKRMDDYTPGTGLVDGGYYQDFDELFLWPVASSGTPIVGDLKFLDFNGDGNVDEQDYVVAENPTIPNAVWNAQLGGGYKNWSMDFSFYGISATQRPVRQGGMFYLYPFTQNKDNAYTVHADHWTPTNTDPEFPSVHSEAAVQYNYQISNFSMIQGKYFRLRNIRLTYKLESKSLKSIGVKSMDLSLIGTNLYTWKELDWGGDPEGFNFGVDFGAYPQSKRLTLEVHATF